MPRLVTCQYLTFRVSPPGGVQGAAGASEQAGQVHPLGVHLAHKVANSGATGRRIHGYVSNGSGRASYRVRQGYNCLGAEQMSKLVRSPGLR